MTERQKVLLLLTSYLLLVAFFLWRALPIKAPLIVTDEVQYRLLAENLHRYGHFLLRGHFPTTIAPLYSVVLALWEFWPLRADQASLFQSLNALLFTSALFPLYLLARFWAFAPLPAIGLAILCLLLPHSFYVATCMSENLYFPLALTFVYLVFRLFEAPRLKTALLTGGVGGAVILTKTSGAFLLLSLVLVLPWAAFSRRKLLYLGPLALLLAALLYLPWLLSKHLALGGKSVNTLGAYSSNWQVVWQKIFSLESLRMLCVYSADFVFATGFVSVPLVGLYWLRPGAERRLQVFYLFLLSLLLVSVAALFSGLNTGWLRERHMFVLFPLYVLLFFYIWPRFDREKRLSALPWVLVFLLLCALLFGLYDFRVAAPTMESPWVNLVTTAFSILHWPPKMVYRYFPLCLLPFVLLWVGLLAWGDRRVLTLWFLVFFLLPSTVTISIMHQWSERLRHSPQGTVLRWIKEKIGIGHRLLVTGRHAYFEPAFLQQGLDARLVEWNESFFLRAPFVYRLEMAGLYDLRMADSPDELRDLFSESQGSVLLTALTLRGAKPLAVLGPLHLYRVSIPPEIVYRTELDPRWFSTRTGRHLPCDAFRQRIEVFRSGWAVYGPYRPLSRGCYQVIYLLDCLKPSSLVIDVYVNSLGTLARRELTCYQEGTRPSLTFEVKEPKAKYEFRIFLKRGGLIFNGVVLSLRDGGT